MQCSLGSSAAERAIQLDLINLSGVFVPWLCKHSGASVLAQVVPTGGGSPVSYTFPVNGPAYSEIIPAPGTPGTYTVATT